MNQHSEEQAIPCIIPTMVRDYVRMEPDFRRLFECLPISELIFIGPSQLGTHVHADAEKHSGLNIKYLNEESLVSYERVKDAICSRMKKEAPDNAVNIRYGWYLQQFLKIAYHEICGSDFYMSWDMDTIPLHRIEMFNTDGKPYFDIKSEHIPSYFNTVKRMFGFGKLIKASFVSEHMVFSRMLLAEMTDEIMSLEAEGETFYEKIISSIAPADMELGFSEFETFGTWTAMRHPDAYRLRQWNSLRRGSWFLDRKDLTEEDLSWFARDYDAVTFEDREPFPEMNQLFRDGKYREKLSARQFYETILESGYFGDYEDGKITAGEWSVPV